MKSHEQTEKQKIQEEILLLEEKINTLRERELGENVQGHFKPAFYVKEAVATLYKRLTRFYIRRNNHEEKIQNRQALVILSGIFAFGVIVFVCWLLTRL